MTRPAPLALARLGTVFYSVSIVAFGVLHLVFGGFVTRVIPGGVSWMPAGKLPAHAVGALLLLAGLALVLGWKRRTTALALGGFIVVAALACHLPAALVNPRWGGLWTNLGKGLALAGGAWLVASLASADAEGNGDSGGFRRSSRLGRIGQIFVGAFLVLCGVQHFLYAEFVVQLMPRWIPGATFWTYFSAVALIAAGVSFVLGWLASLAGKLTGVMIFTWTLVLHLPRALADLNNANEVTAFFEALAMSGIAWLITARLAGTAASSSSNERR